MKSKDAERASFLSAQISESTAYLWFFGFELLSFAFHFSPYISQIYCFASVIRETEQRSLSFTAFFFFSSHTHYYPDCTKRQDVFLNGKYDLFCLKEEKQEVGKHEWDSKW